MNYLTKPPTINKHNAIRKADLILNRTGGPVLILNSQLPPRPARSHPTSHIPHPTSHIPHLTSYILHLTSYILHLTSYILHLTSHNHFLLKLSSITAVAIPTFNDSANPTRGMVILLVTHRSTPSPIPLDSLPMTMNPPCTGK